MHQIEHEFYDFVYPESKKEYIRYSARGLVINEKGEIAILHIKGIDDFGERDHYEFPGGGIEANEDPKFAFEREIKEEIGVIVTDSMHLTTVQYSYNILKRYEIGYYFVAKSTQYIAPHLTELEARLFHTILWLPAAKILDLLNQETIKNVGKIIHQRERWILNKFLNDSTLRTRYIKD